MEKSAKFEKVKGYYDSGLWNIVRVHNAVIKGWIIEEEFEEITGIAVVMYADAIDPAELEREYTETDIKIEREGQD